MHSAHPRTAHILGAGKLAGRRIASRIHLRRRRETGRQRASRSTKQRPRRCAWSEMPWMRPGKRRMRRGQQKPQRKGRAKLRHWRIPRGCAWPRLTSRWRQTRRGQARLCCQLQWGHRARHTCRQWKLWLLPLCPPSVCHLLCRPATPRLHHTTPCLHEANNPRPSDTFTASSHRPNTCCTSRKIRALCPPRHILPSRPPRGNGDANAAREIQHLLGAPRLRLHPQPNERPALKICATV